MPIPTHKMDLSHLRNFIDQILTKIKAEFDQNDSQVILWEQIFKGQDLNKFQNTVSNIRWKLSYEFPQKIIPSNPKIQTLFAQVAALSKMIVNIRHNEMKTQAKQYFQKLLDTSCVIFKQKSRGIHQGFIVEIQQGFDVMRYFCKYHHAFEMTTKHGEFGRVDLREIFIYKFLQFLGIGAQTYFYYFDMMNFHIATKDVVCYEDEDGSFPSFYTFWRLKKYKPEMLNDQCVKQGIILLDIITRIMGLVDTIDNEINFGFRITEQNKVQLKIVDSLPPRAIRDHTADKQRYINEDIFEQWFQGYAPSFWDKEYLQPAIQSIIKPFSRSKEQRLNDRCMRIKVKEAKDVFQKLKEIKFTHFTKQARRFILSMLKDPVLDPTYLELLDLDDYINGINQNYEILVKQYSQQLWLVEQMDRLKAQRNGVQV